MKSIGSVKEDLSVEKRISITPETVKQFVNLHFSVFIEKNYGEHIGISNDKYQNAGATFCDSAKEVLEKSPIILKVNSPSNNEVDFIKDNSILLLPLSTIGLADRLCGETGVKTMESISGDTIGPPADRE